MIENTGGVSRRGALRLTMIAGALAAPLRAASATASDADTTRAVQGQLNSKPGPRTVPARTIPVPADLDAATSALVAAPYSPFWNLDAPNDAGWQAIIDHANKATQPFTAKLREALGVTIEPTTLGGVPAFIVTPRQIPQAHANHLVLHLHGGGYILGAGEAGTGEAALVAAIGGYKVLAIDYRVPPSAPFPAALDDVTAAWRAVVATSDPRQIAVEGTSAGGGLTLALMLRAKAEGLPMPAAIAAGSPAADLTTSGDSLKANEWVDNVIVSLDGFASKALRLYAGQHDFTDPMLSPLHGDFHGFPPAILTSGTRDLLLSDTVRAHRKLRRAGVTADLHVYEGLSHGQYLFDPTGMVPREVFSEIARFFDAHLANA
jgi:acetyl esterase/lipase